MNRFTQRRGDEYWYDCWIVADSDGGLRMVRGQPDAGRGEVAVSMVVKVPLGLFRKPLLKATVVVPESAGVSDAEAIAAVVEVIARGSAFDVDVRAEP